MIEKFTRWMLLPPEDGKISSIERRQAWDRLRGLCRDLELDIPSLQELTGWEIRMNAGELDVLNEDEIVCFSRVDERFVVLNVDIGCLTGQEVTQGRD